MSPARMCSCIAAAIFRYSLFSMLGVAPASRSPSGRRGTSAVALPAGCANRAAKASSLFNPCR